MRWPHKLWPQEILEPNTLIYLAIRHDGAVIALQTSQAWLISNQSVCRGPWQLFASN